MRTSIISVMAGVAASLLSMQGNATIVGTGGSVSSGSNTQPIAAGNTTFSVSSSTTILTGEPPTIPTIVQIGQASGAIGPTGISLQAGAQSICSFGNCYIYGDASGSFGFQITAPSAVTFSWSDIASANPTSSLDIVSASNGVVLGCVGSDLLIDPNLGGCALNANPSGQFHGPLSQGGTFNLAAGLYTLNFAANSTFLVGTPDNAGFDFSLIGPGTTVPLPASLWMLLGGFAALAVGGHRRRSHSPHPVG